MEIYVYWFLFALILLGLEMVTGTFYLLVLAIAVAVGGLSAILGAGAIWQLVLSAITGIAGIIMLRRWNSAPANDASTASFDIGQTVKIIKWNEDGSARVFYRGAEWDATLESTDIPRDGTLYIAAVHGSGLVLTHRNTQQH